MQYESICRLWSLLPRSISLSLSLSLSVLQRRVPPFFQLDLITCFLPRGRLARGTFRFSPPLRPSNGLIDRFLADSARYTWDRRSRSLQPKSKSARKTGWATWTCSRASRILARPTLFSGCWAKLSRTSFRRKSIRAASLTTRIYVIKSFQLVPFVLLGRKFN